MRAVRVQEPGRQHRQDILLQECRLAVLALARVEARIPEMACVLAGANHRKGIVAPAAMRRERVGVLTTQAGPQGHQRRMDNA